MAAAATIWIPDQGVAPVAAWRDGMPGSAVTWDPDEMRLLALPGCRECWGDGVKWGRRLFGAPYPCGCVLRTIFRQCLVRYRHLEAHCGDRMAAVRLRLVNRGPRRFRSWDRPEQEYCADFCLIARRALSDRGYWIFRMHFLLGADWMLCCRKLGMERGRFFHQMYLVEERLGYALRTVRPYALHPVAEYFHSGGTS